MTVAPGVPSRLARANMENHMNKERSLWSWSRSFMLSFGAAGGFVMPPEMLEEAGGDAVRGLHIVTATDAGLAGTAVDRGATEKWD